MLVSNFSPQIDVTVIPSVFSRKFEVSIKGLPPNEAMEYWFFEPDGDNVGTGEVNSDSHGEYVDKEGNHVISYIETCSQPIKKGIYHFGVNRIKYKKNAKGRMSLGIWNELPGEKKLVDFHVEYTKHSLLTLDVEKKVPWGMKTKISGELWLREEPFPWCSGAIDFKDRKIILNGNDINYADILTDGFSKFSREVQVGNNPRSDCFVQAHYDGDPIFFEKCDSEVIAYEIVKHQSILSLGIESLVPILGNPTDLGLKAGRFYLLKGHPHDTTLDGSISDRIIKLVGPVEFHLSSAVTDAEGCYTLCIKIPDSSGTYSIVGTFDGDELYDGSTARLLLEIKPNSSPKISAFKRFKAFDSFKNGFEDYKEQPQIRSSIWLLSILDANPIVLGIFDKNRDGEQITENGIRLNFSADIIADFDDVPLVIDCTTGVPETQKIDKIYNTARYLTEKTSERFVPIIISNQSAKGMKQEAIKNSVLLLDRDDISEITDRVLDNAVNNAKQIFLDKLKEVL